MSRGRLDGQTDPVRRCLVVTVTFAALATAACSSGDGRELPPPRQSTTTVVSEVTGADADTGGPVDQDGTGGDAAFRLTSPAVEEGGELPARFTCRGAGVSPPLSWTRPPAAQELAIVVRDLDDRDAVHWIVTSLDPVVQGFASGGLPEGALSGPTSGGSNDWDPPCPAGGTHRYEIALHALAEPMVSDPGLGPAETAAVIEATSSDRARMTVVVSAR
jgi:phosphatidylethanolamine-binding protein (PEBP) family uncharacterized protein